MAANVTFNPVLTTVASGSFNVQSEGYIQGTALNDPAVRNQLSGGFVAAANTLPLWGGVAVSTQIPTPYSAGGTLPQANYGQGVVRATNYSTTGAALSLTGFTVFDQAHAMITTPQSPVPLAGTYMTVSFYELGSRARIAVACDPLLASLEAGVITQQVSWDWNNQLLVPYLGTSTISSGTYNNTTGVIVLTLSAAPGFSAGDSVVLSGLTGTGAYASLNGTFTVTSVVSTAVTLAGTAGVGASTITGGTLTPGSGASAAIPVRVLDLNLGNGQTVVYNSTTGFATWNRSGNIAIIEI